MQRLHAIAIALAPPRPTGLAANRHRPPPPVWLVFTPRPCRSHHHFWDLRGKEYDDVNVGPRGQIVYGLAECLEDMCDGESAVPPLLPGWPPSRRFVCYGRA